MKPVKAPRDHTYCSKCELPYSFIKCRITFSSPHRNICLKCAVQEEYHGTVKVLPANHKNMDDENEVEETAPKEVTEDATDAPAETTE